MQDKRLPRLFRVLRPAIARSGLVVQPFEAGVRMHTLIAITKARAIAVCVLGLALLALPVAVRATPTADEKLAADVMATRLEPYSTSMTTSAGTRLNLTFLKPAQWSVQSGSRSLLLEPVPNPFDVGVIYSVALLGEDLATVLPFWEKSTMLGEETLTAADGTTWTVEHRASVFPDRRPMQFWMARRTIGAVEFLAMAGASEDVLALYEPVLSDILTSLQITAVP